MLSIERHEKILNELDKRSTVKVTYLSEMLQVTEKTIRIDLETLENQGHLKRIHGGATLPKEGEQLLPIKKRQMEHGDVKHAIAVEALQHIQKNDTILIDGGSTTEAFAELLGEVPVTVITNDIKVAYKLLPKEKVHLMMAGGTRIGTSGALFGAESSKMLKTIRVNKIFFGTTGISIENGLTVFNGIHADWKKEAMQCSNEIFLLADSSKFQKDALIQFAVLEDINTIITDSALSEQLAEGITRRGVQVIKSSAETTSS
ncbi:DeoR/GlpR family DNA-binding transcription regulator [Alkalicoccus daliensis]|uniref:Transcriptional regulator, DeoR family n=1 Tax=Alkalicoccus daliensis TaxID=745820 RepID=A0A1H0F0A8_9BACI|nr:DeoR/GlpR family DNA-binding transcription regulator [Alkalicoccus daliensis]SDN88072.1 transcriptional regulator, DeoR family [Alkalicoccus daliensis]